MSQVAFLLSVLASAVSGGALGFATGLVPGLHMNNIAAAIVAFSSVFLALSSHLSVANGSSEAGTIVSCFVSAALVGHIFSESVVSTYVGIPDEDVVSVLPAHRLARAGMGAVAVHSSMDGALAGIVYGALMLFPACAVMGSPVFAYRVMRGFMPVLISFFIVLLIASEGYPGTRFSRHVPGHVLKMASASALFMGAGVLGACVLMTDYYASPVPDFPWMKQGFVPRSSLLLPLFAGFFGVPSLLLNIRSRSSVFEIESNEQRGPARVSTRERLIALLGGVVVGWLPGMTSGAAATVCSLRARDFGSSEEVSAATRFIWLYSAISSSGAVMSLGALFVLQRARSGSMDAVSFFVGSDLGRGAWLWSISLMSAILLSMVIAAALSYCVLSRSQPTISRFARTLCSRRVAMASLAFVIALSISLTGVRGIMVMVASSSLGMIPPMFGIRRLQLMGSLLVPIWMMFVAPP